MNIVKYYARSAGKLVERTVRVWAGRGGYNTLIHVPSSRRAPTVAEADARMADAGFSRERPRA